MGKGLSAPFVRSGRVADRTAAQLRDDLRDARVGDRLPSERALAARYGVSRETVRAALGRLHADGVLHPSPSRGWFVAQNSSASSVAAGLPDSGDGGVRGFADLAAAKGLPATAIVLEQAVRPCTVEESERLAMAPGADLFTMRRLRFLDGQVVVLEHNRVPLALAPALVDTDFRTASLFATMRSADPPQVPSVAEYEVEARVATAAERELLQIDDATPVLTALQLARNQYGRPMEDTLAVYRADRYRFRGSIAH